MFNLLKLLEHIRKNEITSIDLCQETLPDYSSQPDVIEWNNKYLRNISGWQKMVLLCETKLLTSLEENIYLWDITERSCINVIATNSKIINLVKLSEDSFLTSHIDDTVKMWRVNNDIFMENILIKNEKIYSMLLLSNKYLATGSDNGLIQITHIDSKKLIYPALYGHNSLIRYLINHDKTHFISVDIHHLIRWYIKTMTIDSIIETKFDICAIISNADGNIYLGDESGNIYYLDVSTRECINILKISHGGIYSIKALPDGKMIVGSCAGAICIFKRSVLIQSQSLFYLRGINVVNGIEVLSDGRVILSAYSGENKILMLRYPQRPLDLQEIEQIIMSLKDNNSVSSINLSNVIIPNDDFEVLLEILNSARRDINIIGAPKLN